MAQIADLNPHDRPPHAILQAYKKHQKLPLPGIASDESIIDLQSLDPDHLPPGISLQRWTLSENLRPAFDQFVHEDNGFVGGALPVFTHQSVSGLQMIPSLLPPSVQIELLSRLFHRDLSNPEHKTNLHLHYNITYPSQPHRTDSQATSFLGDSTPLGSQSPSFFQDDPARFLYPKDPEVHKPITVQSMLEKRLRWVTLGGQYDWTAKVYPPGRPPRFPEDVTALLRAAFPETEAQAAILNVYSARDTLSPHRDVSEECDMGLISVSFGCDGLFLISHDNGDGGEIIRLRSGDAVYMNGPSRFAWHGVPKVVPETCPDWLADWPFLDDKVGKSRYEAWKGWMSGKRVNLNVRQMAGSSSYTQ